MAFFRAVDPNAFEKLLVLEGDSTVVVSPDLDEQPKFVCAACAHYEGKITTEFTMRSFTQHKPHCKYYDRWKASRGDKNQPQLSNTVPMKRPPPETYVEAEEVSHILLRQPSLV